MYLDGNMFDLSPYSGLMTAAVSSCDSQGNFLLAILWRNEVIESEYKSEGSYRRDRQSCMLIIGF